MMIIMTEIMMTFIELALAYSSGPHLQGRLRIT